MRTAILVLSAAAQLFGQCPMCRTAAAAQGAKGTAVIDAGILILLLPAVAMFTGVLALSFRYRNFSDDDPSKHG